MEPCLNHATIYTCYTFCAESGPLLYLVLDLCYTLFWTFVIPFVQRLSVPLLYQRLTLVIPFVQRLTLVIPFVQRHLSYTFPVSLPETKVCVSVNLTRQINGLLLIFFVCFIFQSDSILLKMDETVVSVK